MTFIAHIRESDRKIQSVAEHLTEVKQLAELIGDKIGVKHIAGLAGLLHDLGKYTYEFKNYIWDAVHNPSSSYRRGEVDHSTAGGKLLFRMFHEKPDKYNWLLAEVVGNAIISHHSYLHDFLNPKSDSPYLNRVRDKELPEYKEAVDRFFASVMGESEFRRYVGAAASELELFLMKSGEDSYESKLMFVTKFVFSALIDADRTNTRMFEENSAELPGLNHGELFDSYYDKLMAELRLYENGENAGSPINLLRQQMSERCEQFAEQPPGIYKLSIPTGGGKTLASLRFALRHAARHGMKHIVYIVPFTTIIEQNAAEVRRILQDDGHILEHHSNVVEDEDDNDELEDGFMSTSQKLKLARDNWDSPVIFTTMVQFLNVIYAKGSRNIRRFHNLSEAVIIFDEVQKVPVHCVSLFNSALNFLQAYGKSSLILCTATQPSLEDVPTKLRMEANAEMVQNLPTVIQAFKRVEIVDRATEESFDTERLAKFVAAQLDEVRSVLVVLNTKTVVRRLCDDLKTRAAGVPVYHLSTSMCAAHRHEILSDVKEHLLRKEPVLCVSTQLIEAGVDISFECVVRSLAGLDSIAQAAGRCNRHGMQGIRQVYVIDHAEENLSRLPEIRNGKHVSAKILADLKRDPSLHGGHLLSDLAMKKYFREFYAELNASLDYTIPELGADMTKLLFTSRNDSSYKLAYEANKQEKLPLFMVNSHRTAAEYFRVIDDRTTAVIVPYGKGKDIITQLNGSETIEDLSRLLREAQQYSVNLYRHERDGLAKNGGLQDMLDGKIFVLKESAYNEKLGLVLENDSGFEFQMF